MTDSNVPAPPPPPPPMPSSAVGYGVPETSTFTNYSLSTNPEPRERVGMGLLFALVAALGAGTIYFLFVTLTKRQSFYVAIGVGAAIGAAHIRGAGKGTKRGGIVSVIIVVITLAVTQYFIDRKFLINALEAENVGYTVPLWMGYDLTKSVMKATFDRNQIRVLFYAISIAAGYMLGANGQLRFKGKR